MRLSRFGKVDKPSTWVLFNLESINIATSTSASLTMDLHAALLRDQEEDKEEEKQKDIHKDKDEDKDEDKDVVLNVEASDIDCLYRIARYTTTDTGIVKRVVYVTVCDASIIPPDERTESFLILKNLSKLAGWTDQTWHTMHVFVTNNGVCTEMDRELTHALPNDTLLAHLPRYHALDVDILYWPKHRIARARIAGEDVFIKFAVFAYELGYLRREVMMYQYMLHEHLSYAPRLLGYVYEESPDRVTGFFFQAIRGRHALVADYDMVLDALHRLHENGIHHGDVNKYNILITPENGVVFIDFEDSTLTATSALPAVEIAGMMQAEEHRLHASLADESNIGAPWDI